MLQCCRVLQQHCNKGVLCCRCCCNGVECASAHLPTATLQQRTLQQRCQPLGGGFKSKPLGAVCTYSVSANRLWPETVAKGFCFGEVMSKSIKDYMIIWRDGGAVELERWPAHGPCMGKSWGACYPSLQAASFEDRKQAVFIQAMHMIVRDKCDPALVHRVLSELEEYEDGCADDMPGIAKIRARKSW